MAQKRINARHLSLVRQEAQDLFAGSRRESRIRFTRLSFAARILTADRGVFKSSARKFDKRLVRAAFQTLEP